MKFDGKFDVSSPPAQVWAVLIDPNKVGKAIPDVKTLQVKDEKSFYAEFTVKLGFFKGVMEMNFTYENLEPPEHMLLVGRGSGVQSTVDLSIDLHTVASGTGSTVSWSSTISVGGLVAGLGGRIMEGFAKKKIEEIIEGLKKVIATP